MTVALHFGFDGDSHSIMSGTFNAGIFATTITLTASYFPDSSGTVAGVNYISLAYEIQEKVNEAGVAGLILTCSYDHVENKFTIDNGANPFSASLSKPLAQALGMDADTTLRRSDTLTSSWGPFFIWRSQYNNVSDLAREYESDSGYTDHYADDGTPYSIGKLSASVFEDFTFPNEPKQKVYDIHSTSAEPWTWQKATIHARSRYPFLMFNTGSTTINYAASEKTYRLTSNGAKFNPRSVFRNYDGHWNLDIEAQVIDKNR